MGRFEIELVHTPGHTPGSQCFSVDGRLVSGDTLFFEGCGRTDLPGGDPEQMYESITTRLARFGDETILYPGHFYAAEPSATIGETRPAQLRLQAALGRAVADHVRLLTGFANSQSGRNWIKSSSSARRSQGSAPRATLEKKASRADHSRWRGAEHHPYDRPPLSKQFLAGKWDEARITLVCQEKARRASARPASRSACDRARPRAP